jgi:hypothetical protein
MVLYINLEFTSTTAARTTGRSIQELYQQYNSRVTRFDYDKYFSYFITFCNITDYESMLTMNSQVLEGLIRGLYYLPRT